MAMFVVIVGTHFVVRELIQPSNHEFNVPLAQERH